jgi:hypothetical protein
MNEAEVGQHVEQRFVLEGRYYTVSTIVRAHGVSVEEVSIDGGPRGYIAGVVFESEASALSSAHQLALNLIEGECLGRTKPLH